MEDNYAKILWDGYGIKLYHGSRTRTGFVCKTDNGVREIKKVRYRLDDICFEHDTKEHLYNNGFQNISRFYTTLEGQPYFFLDGNYYLLENLMDMPSLEENSIENFSSSAKTLAKLHIAGTGVVSKFPKYQNEDLALIFQKRKNEFIKIKKRIDKQSSYHALDLIVMKNYHYYYYMIERAQELLFSSGYEAEISRARAEKNICHNMFKGENIRQDENGNIFVVGFGKCAYDTPLMDLVTFLRRYIKKMDADAKGAREILNAYSSLRELEAEDINIVRGLLSYPDKFIKLCNEYYNKRRVCISQAMLERMESCIREKDKTDAFLKGMKEF